MSGDGGARRIFGSIFVIALVASLLAVSSLESSAPAGASVSSPIEGAEVVEGPAGWEAVVPEVQGSRYGR